MRFSKMTKTTFIFLLFTSISIPLEAMARIKLITLPVRERVEVQLDHPNVTLVEEERIVPLVRGVNQVDFAWANTRIDPETLVFRVLASAHDKAIDIKVLSVSYPPNENALVWAVSASDSGAARVRISYVLGGLEKQFHYRALADQDEKQITLSHYLRVKNFANETYEQTQVWVGFGKQFSKSLGLNETKEVLVNKYDPVPIKKIYTIDPVEFGYLNRSQDKLNVPMHYVIRNDKKHQLGEAALPYGKVRIFQQDSQGTAAFLGEDWGQFTPVDDEMKLYLGLAQDIVVKRTIDRNQKKRIAGNLYDYDVVIKYEIENFKDSAVQLHVTEQIRTIRNEIKLSGDHSPEWVIGSETTLSADTEKSDAEKIVFYTDLPARESSGKAYKQTHKLHLMIKNEW